MPKSKAKEDELVSYLLRCFKKQRKAWQAKADASNMTLAQWIRTACDQGPIFRTETVVTRVEEPSPALTTTYPFDPVHGE